jgi:N-acyl-D-amino-acid deacylase
MFDIIIKGGTVIDGTGDIRRRADVGIQGDRIAAVDDLSHAQAGRVIDAGGMVVCPGFIDTHVHSDVALLHDRQHAAGLRQGITTEVLAQDGLSYAPLSRENLTMYAKYLGGLNGTPPIDWDWSSVAGYRAQFHNRVAVNTVYMVPHGTIRLEAVGFRDVPLIGEGLERARQLIRQGFAEGAAAFSTGLSYYPCSYADTDEMVALCETVAECGGFYVTHLRTVFREERFDAVREAIEVGERSGAPVHFSHFRPKPGSPGQTESLVLPLEQAIDRGLDVTAELYPYPVGSSYGCMFLPLWAHDGGPDAILQRLAHPATRRRIARNLDPSLGSWQSVRFSSLPSPANRYMIGRTVAEIAAEQGVAPEEFFCALMLEEQLQVGFVVQPPTDAAVWDGYNRDVLTLLTKPYYMVGSDSIPSGQQPHPRAYGCFPRILRLQREHLEIISLETLIQRMTANAAARFKLKDRGVLAAGKAADVVVFNPETVTDRATYDHPFLFPEGIEHVLVNGGVAVSSGVVTGLLKGAALPTLA